MKIFSAYKRSRFFLWINVSGLAIGLAVSIMLILFVVNEFSFDRHFANHERIIRLLTVFEEDGSREYFPRNPRQSYTEIPQQVPGIEAVVQIFDLRQTEVIHEQNRFQNVKTLLTDPEFFQVFQMRFVEGTPQTALIAPNSAVLTRAYAEIMFGSPQEAMNQVITYDFFGTSIEAVITGVVESLPANTHFQFDLLGAIQSIPWLNYLNFEFHTYYLIQEGVSIETVRANIENVYRTMLQPFETIGIFAHGETEMLRNVYLRSKSASSLGATGSMGFIWILSGLALFVLMLAVTNFINLFLTQGQMRMMEIGIRKTNGAQISDIIRLFFAEVAVIVGIAFAIGFIIALYFVPFFGGLINKNIDLAQMLNPAFIISALLLYAATVFLSAFYPAIYLSRFSPLEILGKRIRFSKRRLTAVTVVFQSVISIILLSAIFVLFKQTAHLERMPLGLNPENVMSVRGNETINANYEAVKQELLNFPEVEAVAGSHHTFGRGWSGQGIAHWGTGEHRSINEYRLMTGMPELMELELVEGRFWQEDDPRNILMLILNESAVRMLGGESPLEKIFDFNGREARVVGVVRDFYYENNLMLGISPIVLTRVFDSRVINIRFTENVSRTRAQEITQEVLQNFDSGFMLNPIWSADIYRSKIKPMREMTRIILIGSALSIFVAMLGLLAIHLFATVRRTKEIGIRRIHGASKTSVFVLLSLDVLKWIAFASVIAIPIAVYLSSELLSHYANRISLDWTVFVLPVLLQCVIAMLATSGVTISVLSRSLVKSLKTE